MRRSSDQSRSKGKSCQEGSVNWRLCCLLSGLAGPLLWSQASLGLEQAIDLALRNNREISASRLEVEKAENRVLAARKYKLPQFRVNVLGFTPLTGLDFRFPTGAFGTFPTTGPIPPADTTIGTPRGFSALVLAGADQPLTQLRRINLSIELEELNRQVAIEHTRQLEQAVANKVKTAYYDIFEAQTALGANEEAQTLYREVERFTEQNLEQQTVLPSDLLDVQQRVAEVELDRVSIQNAILNRKEQLNLLMGRALETEFSVVAIPGAPEEDLTAAAARTRALEARTEAREARIRLRQAELDRDFTRSQFFPDLSLTVDYLGLGHISFVPSNTVVAGVSLSWNPFDWGRRKAELRVKSGTLDQARIATQETEAQIALDVNAKLRALEESRARLKVSTLARRSAEEKLRVMRNRQEQQTAQLKDTLQMQVALADANLKYEKDVLAVAKARADLQKAMGER